MDIISEKYAVDQAAGSARGEPVGGEIGTSVYYVPGIIALGGPECGAPVQAY